MRITVERVTLTRAAAMSHTVERVILTRRRRDAEKKQESQNLRTQRKGRDVGWRHRPCEQFGAYFGLRQDLSAHAPEGGQNRTSNVMYASLRSHWTSADSALSGFDFLISVLRVFLRVSASPRQARGLSDSGFAASGALT
jgi:hypothetical protein